MNSFLSGLTKIEQLAKAAPTKKNKNFQVFKFLNANKEHFTLQCPKGGIRAGPQATVSLPFDRVFSFFLELAREKSPLRSVANVAKQGLDLQFYATLISHIQTLHLSNNAKAILLFLTDLRCYGAKMGRVQDYAKLYMTNLCRSDLASMFALLSAADKAFIASKSHPPGDEARGLQSLIEEIGDTTKCRSSRSKEPWPEKMFPEGWKEQEDPHQVHITAPDFFGSLVRGENKLKGKDFLSFGMMPASLDSIVFELRRMKAFVQTDSARAYVLRSIDMYDFVYRLRHAPEADVPSIHYIEGTNQAKPANHPTRCNLIAVY
jgi:hypothetical protein